MAKKTLALIVFLLAALPIAQAHAAASFAFVPASANLLNGASFTVSIVVNADQPINAVQGTVVFPPDRLQVVNVSKANSVFQFWSQEPSLSNANGALDFGAGLPSPGFTGANGLILKVTFKTSESGTSTIAVIQGAILANDGLGTNLLGKATQGIYVTSPTLAPASSLNTAPQITSQNYPDSKLWYNQTTADFSWRTGLEIDRIAYEFGQLAKVIPTTERAVVDKVEYSLADKPDGIWYFNLRLHVRGAWSSILTKKIKVDRTPPSILKIRKITVDPTDIHPAFVWVATDTLSGIKAYRAKVDGGDWLGPVAQDPARVILPTQSSGNHVLLIEASDFAGNTSETKFSFEVEPIVPSDTDGTTSQDVLIDQSRASAKWNLTMRAADLRTSTNSGTALAFSALQDSVGELLHRFGSWWIGLIARFSH